MTAILLTLAQAKAHLGITLPPGDPGDADLQLKLDQAEAVIRGYLKAKNDPGWTPDTVPPPVTAAILLLMAHLEINRGGEDEQQRDEALWLSIDRLLAFHRDPTWA
jgi:hypothetical protein